MNISETKRPSATKLYLKQHWGGGKAAVGSGPDWIVTLVSMATDSFHRDNGGNLVTVVYVIFCRNFWLQYRNIQDGGPNKHENVSSF